MGLDLLLHDLHHLLADQLLVGSLGVAGRLHLLLRLLGESDAEHADVVAVLRLRLDERLNQRVPLLDHRAPVIPGDVHAVEVGVAVEVLDLLDLELELSPGGGISTVVAVSERDAEHAASEAIGGVDETGRLVHGGHRDAALLEARSEDVVPLFLGEGVLAIHC